MSMVSLVHSPTMNKKSLVTEMLSPLSTLHLSVPFPLSLLQSLPLTLSSLFSYILLLPLPSSPPSPLKPMVMHLACVNLHMSMPEALAAATINAAAALGLSDKYGSIETGKKGDLLIINAAR